MKQGRNLTELAQELERQASIKKDYVMQQSAITLFDSGDIEFGGNLLTPTNLFHRQLGEKIGIPAKYYDRMKSEAPHLLARNVNHWMSRGEDRRMVRTLGESARAFLSDRYRPLDNYDLVETVLPVIMDSRADVVSCEVTDSNLFIKAVVPGIEAQIPPPGVETFTWGKDHHGIDVVNPGIVIGNSEVGLRSLYISPAIHTVRCSNLAVFKQDAMRKYHIGPKMDEDIFEVFTDRTKEVTEAAVWLQVRDLLTAALSGTVFTKLVERLKEARGDVIEGDIVKVVEVFATKNRLNDDERGGVLRALAQGGDLTRYGLSSAVTRFSQEAKVDYDRATELEELGAQVIEMPKRDWNAIAMAA